MKISEIIKQIRLNNGLTQKEFAKKFYLTEKTVSNYENDQRTPDLDFLNKLCTEFNISLDYFMKSTKSTSKAEDLVVCEKNDKKAIFDVKQSTFLTEHIFDNILLSNSGVHIGEKYIYETDEDGDIIKNIYFCSVIDNDGKVKELPDINFCGQNYNNYGTCPAINKNTKLTHLIDNKGNLLSKGFKIILPLDSENNFGIYFGKDYYPYEERYENHNISDCELLYYNGNGLDIGFDNINDRNSKVSILSDINIAFNYIEKYGVNIIKLIPELIFENSNNYEMIIKAVASFYKNNSANEIYTAMKYVMNTLKDYALTYKPKPKTIKNIDDLYFIAKESQINRLVCSSINKMIYELYKWINLII